MKNKIFNLLSIFLLISSVAIAQPSNQGSSNNKTKEVASNTRYYYYPNLQAYYDSSTNLYMYKVSKQWVSSEEIPEFYGGYSLFSKYRVEIKDYDGDDVTALLPLHKVKFPYNSKGRMTDDNANK